ncbi:hypothetical protein K492DRAFT_195055 [Lichtheimia hyalospora FSU 10163]|nr:hypothetical protein K492DRAFT_195055 [Lichtheimia hyalospora FSU 10163]
MQSTSIFNRGLLLQTTGNRKRTKTDWTSFRTRQWRSTPLILTIDQVRHIGKAIGLSTLRKADEHFKDPANVFLMSKPKLIILYNYMVDLGIATSKATARMKQAELARKVVDLLYPGFPVWRARDRAERLFRESHPVRSGLAYDLVPTTDAFERDQELLRVPVPPLEEEMHELCLSIPIKPLQQYAKLRVKRKADDKDIRLHLYLWLSKWMTWHPDLTYFSVDTHGKGQWTKDDQELIKQGYRHIDITDKVDWHSVLEKSTETNTIDIKCDCEAHVKELSVCTVWCKSPLELTGQLYLQSASTHAVRIMENTPRQQQPIIQRQMMDILPSPYVPKSDIQQLQAIFNSCFNSVKCINTSSSPSSGASGNGYDDKNEEDELILGDQSISLLDPMLLSRLEYPARGIYCTHASCFDARVFFLCQLLRRVWKCYICNVQYKSIQDLYIDHEMAQALSTYPEDERLVLRNGVLLPPENSFNRNDPNNATSSAPTPSVVLDDDDDDTHSIKKQRIS